jgi:phosphotransferase system enzyme I (PtsP)
MRGALGGPRVLQRRLREVVAELVSAQERLDKIVVMIASGELSALAKPGLEPAVRRPLHLRGCALSDGIALGHVVLHEPRVVVTSHIADDVPKELTRLEEAVGTLQSDLDLMLERGDVADGGEHRGVLEAYRMFAYDRGWLRRLREAVKTGLTAEAAVERVQSDTRARMLGQTEPPLRDRLHDLDDLAHRLMRQITGQSHAPRREQLPENAVIVARSMAPAALLDYDRKRLRGLVLEEGGPNSHAAIVARALGIATVGQIENATGAVDPGDLIIIDGTSGDLHVRPAPDVEAAYAERVRLRARRLAQYMALRDRPCITKDGQPFTLMLNAGFVVDLPHLGETGAAGIGLFRTELQFMISPAFPRASEQHSLYQAVLNAAHGRPVTFRTLDVGGDKLLPYMRSVEEENPALGWRAIRLGLDRPGLLRSQARALLKATSGRELKVMFPMIATVDEFDRAKMLVERELTHLRRHGYMLPERVEVGAMVEVPSLLFQLDELLERADFLSVGSNDLVQFLYAADRGNSLVAERFDPISAPVLRALKDIADKGRAHGKPVTLCGELASKPIGALALIALGYRSLSVTATAVGPVKAMLLGLDALKASSILLPLLDAPSKGASLREKLEAFAAAEGLQL